MPGISEIKTLMVDGCEKEIKRYALLLGADYYPCKWRDFRGSFHSVEEAREVIKTLRLDFGSGVETPYDPDSQWYQIIDKFTDEMVEDSEPWF